MDLGGNSCLLCLSRVRVCVMVGLHLRDVRLALCKSRALFSPAQGMGKRGGRGPLVCFGLISVCLKYGVLPTKFGRSVQSRPQFDKKSWHLNQFHGPPGRRGRRGY